MTQAQRVQGANCDRIVYHESEYFAGSQRHGDDRHTSCSQRDQFGGKNIQNIAK